MEEIFQNASIGRRVLKVLYRTYFQICVIFLPRCRHETPRTINHPKTLKMFEPEHVLMAALYEASQMIWMRTEMKKVPKSLRILGLEPSINIVVD